MSRKEQLIKLARCGLALLIELILGLESQIRELRRQIKELQGRLAKAQKEIDALQQQLQQAPPKPAPTTAEAGGEEE